MKSNIETYQKAWTDGLILHWKESKPSVLLPFIGQAIEYAINNDLSEIIDDLNLVYGVLKIKAES